MSGSCCFATLHDCACASQSVLIDYFCVTFINSKACDITSVSVRIEFYCPHNAFAPRCKIVPSCILLLGAKPDYCICIHKGVNDVPFNYEWECAV
eukprot:6173910-Pleurochrysis_carterae.AAC.4